ncbi:MAG: pilin [Candidatus Pacebacteria bacterium]|jgi:hypothetical protein|nr:pilin [Candidatus Paceibacterota bacterium]
MTFTQKIGFLVACVPVLFLGMLSIVSAQTESSPTASVTPVTLENPLRVDSLEALLVAILNIFITLMIPVIVFFIILAGFKYVTAQGNPGRIEEATTTFTYAIIGGVLILAAVAIAEIIKNTVAAF